MAGQLKSKIRKVLFDNTPGEVSWVKLDKMVDEIIGLVKKEIEECLK